MLFISTTRYRINKLPNGICFYGHFQSTEKIVKYQYLDEYKLQYSNLHYTRRITGNVATVASRWRHCVDLTGPGVEPQTFRTDSVRFATELTAGYSNSSTKNNEYQKKMLNM